MPNYSSTKDGKSQALFQYFSKNRRRLSNYTHAAPKICTEYEKNAATKSAIIFFFQLLRFFLTFRSAYATICSVANRIIICRNISALPKMLAKASMRNTNFKKYAGLFRRPPNVANRIRLRRATSNAHVFNKISYAGLSKRSQRGGLENR